MATRRLPVGRLSFAVSSFVVKPTAAGSTVGSGRSAEIKNHEAASLAFWQEQPGRSAKNAVKTFRSLSLFKLTREEQRIPR